MSPPKVDGSAKVAPRTNANDGIPTQAIDSSKIEVDSPEFKKLSPSYQKAVVDAKAYAAKFDGMSPPPKVLVTPSSAGTNGGAPVTVVVPPGAKDPVTVQTHYHGDRAYSTSGTNGAANEIVSKIKDGDKTVYVLPEAKKPVATGNGTDWGNVKNIGGTADEALKYAGIPTNDITRNVSVHSAGGRALANALDNGEKLQAHDLVIQDALYEPAYSTMVEKLPKTDAKIDRVTLQGSDEVTGQTDRRKTLARAIGNSGPKVEIAKNTSTHDQASRVFEQPPVNVHSDGFEPARRHKH